MEINTKFLTVTDDFSHECMDIADNHSIGGEYVVRVLDQVARFMGYPQAVRTDQGPEFTNRANPRRRLHRELQRQVPRRALE